MKRSLEKIFKVLFIIIVITALAAPRAVLAQDVAPTEEPAATEVVTTDVPTEAPVIEETAVVTEAATEAATEEATEVDIELPTEAVTEVATEAAVETAAPTEAPVEEEIIAEVVEALAEEEAILVDGDGNPIALGSTQAEEAISSGDPWFVDNTNNKHLIAYFTTQAACDSWLASPPEGAGDPAYSFDCYWSGITSPIQAAIDDSKSTDSTIHLTGTFSNETINITKSVTIDGGGTTTINAPSNLLSNSNKDIDGGSEDYYGLIFINNVVNNITVVIKNLILNGGTINDSNFSNSTNAVGVLVGNANVTLENLNIINFNRPTSGANNGIGVLSYNNPKTVTLNYNTITGNNVGVQTVANSNESWLAGTNNNVLNNSLYNLEFNNGNLANSWFGINPADYFKNPKDNEHGDYFVVDGISYPRLFAKCQGSAENTYPPCTFNGVTVNILHGNYSTIYSLDNYDKFATAGKFDDIEPYEIWPFVTGFSCPPGTEYEGGVCVPEKKMDICHADSGAPTYTLNNVSVKSVLNTSTCLLKASGHGGHPNDIIPAYDCGGGKTFAGQGDQTIWANKCVVPNPLLTLVKSVSPATYDEVGDVLSYQYLVTNTGNVNLTGLTVTDDKVAVTCPVSSLAVGAPTTCTASYTIDQTDLDDGSVINIAHADALFGSTPVASPSDTETATAITTSSLSIVKTVSPLTYDEVGDLLSYSYAVKNTGTVTLSGPFTVADDKVTVTCPATATLAPNATITCTASYTIGQPDLDAGSVTNVASASNGTVTSGSDTETATAEQTSGLSLVKTVSPAVYDEVGDLLSYSYEVKNIGNITLNGPFTVADDKVTVTCPATATLAPDAIITCTASYTIGQPDLDAGSVTNVASASNGKITSATDSETAAARTTSALTMVKTVSPATYDEVGDLLSYSYLITNTGTVTLSGPFTVADDKVTVTCPATATLAPNATITCTASYTIGQPDLDAGSVTNVASASNGTVTSGSDTETATADQTKGLLVLKTITSVGPYVAGSTITYSLVITNTGNVTLTDVAVADPNAAIIGTCSAATLAPTASFTCSASHVVSALDIAAGLSYLNTATATSGKTTANGSVTATLDILGCMDPAATNYNASATISDGSCTYPVPPPIFVPVTGATPALAIPVTGGALIPVTGGTLIVSGLGHSCMTYNNGQVICWGLNASGQLGDGTTADKLEPVYVKDLMGVQNLTAGGKHTCALTIDGEIWCWGENSSGQLGNGTTKNSSVPVKVDGLPDKVLSITAGEEFTCVQLMNQEVWCWGKNDLGQLNDGTTKNQSSPVKSKLTTMLAQISGGQGLLLGSDVLGTVNEWVKAQAAAVKQLDSSLSISANRWGDSGCAVASDGSVKCWGSDLVSAAVTGALPAMEVGTGLDHNCSINTDESISCWGSNDSGQLGDGTNKDSSSATLVKNLTKAHALAVGASHTCILSGTSNIAYCWGENTFGQLGNNTTTNSNVPVLVTLPK